MQIDTDDEFKSLMPQLSAEEYEQLKQNILKETTPESIVILTWHGIIIDGYKRYEICQNHNIKFTVVEKEFADRDEVKIFIIQTHLGRRHFNNYVRARLVLQLEELYRKKGLLNKQQAIKQADRYNPKKADSMRQNSDTTNIVPVTPVDTKRELAKLANVSHDTIARVKKILEKATPEQKKQLESGDATINGIYNQIGDKEAEDVLKSSSAEQSEFRKRMHEANQKVAHGKQNGQILKSFFKQIEGFEQQIPKLTPEQLDLTINRVRRLEAALVEAVEKLNKPPQEPPALEQPPEKPASAPEATTPEPPAVQKEEPKEETEQSPEPAVEKPATEDLAENNKTESAEKTENNVHKLELIKRPTMSHGYIAVNGIDNPLLKDIIRGLDATNLTLLRRFRNEFSITSVPRTGSQEKIASPVADVLLTSNINIGTLKKMREFLLLAENEPFEIIPPGERDYDGILGIIDQNNLNIVNHPHFIKAHEYLMNNYVKPENKAIAVFTTCASTKPYPVSNLSEMVKYLRRLKNADAIHWLVLSNATAPVPEELHLCFPFWAYEADIRKLKMKDKIEYVKVTSERLEKYLRKHKYDHYVAYLAEKSTQRAVLQQVQKSLGINIIYTKVVAHGEMWMRNKAQLEELVRTINSLTPV